MGIIEERQLAREARAKAAQDKEWARTHPDYNVMVRFIYKKFAEHKQRLDRRSGRYRNPRLINGHVQWFTYGDERLIGWKIASGAKKAIKLSPSEPDLTSANIFLLSNGVFVYDRQSTHVFTATDNVTESEVDIQEETVDTPISDIEYEIALRFYKSLGGQPVKSKW